jgi:hypothetical protein
MCFERPRGGVVALGTDQDSSIAGEIDAKLGGIFRWPIWKWSEGEGWK